jgi:hypothetical protein
MRLATPALLVLVACSGPPPAATAPSPSTTVATLPAPSAAATVGATEALPIVPLRFVPAGGAGTWELKADGSVVDGHGALVLRITGNTVQDRGGATALRIDERGRVTPEGGPYAALRFGPNDALTGPDNLEITVRDDGSVEATVNGNPMQALGRIEGMAPRARRVGALLAFMASRSRVARPSGPTSTSVPADPALGHKP